MRTLRPRFAWQARWTSVICTIAPVGFITAAALYHLFINFTVHPDCHGRKPPGKCSELLGYRHSVPFSDGLEPSTAENGTECVGPPQVPRLRHVPPQEPHIRTLGASEKVQCQEGTNTIRSMGTGNPRPQGHPCARHMALTGSLISCCHKLPRLVGYGGRTQTTGIWVGGFGRLNETLTLFKTQKM